MPGSTEPERVPIISPSSGVNPMVVSMLLPPRMRASEQPLPRWQVMSLSVGEIPCQELRGAPRAVLMVDSVKAKFANSAAPTHS